MIMMIFTTSAYSQSKAIQFNSGSETDDCIYEYNNPTWVTGNEWTMEVWFKADDVSGGDERHIFRLGGQLYIKNSVLTGSGGYGVAISPDTWYHVAYVRTSTSTTVYLNGSLYSSNANADGGSANMLYLGCYNEYGSGHFSGKMDEFRLWNDARTVDEINEYNRVELTGNEDDLLIYYDFNNGSGNSSVTDRAGGEDNGTLANMETGDWISSGAPLSKVFYVSISGNDNNDGTSEATAWGSIKYAATQTVAGDTVYVKAGTYNNENVVIARSGTSSSPILFEGYKNHVGDITNSYWSYGTNGTNLDASEMPLLDGNNRSTGTAISASNKNYIVIKNLQIKNYQKAIFLNECNNSIIENLVGATFGATTGYSGKGIVITNGGSNTIKNCSILNAGAEAIPVNRSSNNVIDGCKVYCDEGPTEDFNGTDYYIVVTSENDENGIYPHSDNNIVKNCYVYRKNGIAHGGHGIGIKGNGANNQFNDCTIQNTGFYVRHSGAKNNTFNNCTVDDAAIAYTVRDGAHHNNFYNCESDSCASAVYFTFSNEEYDVFYGDPEWNAGHDNQFYNCVFKNLVGKDGDGGYYTNFAIKFSHDADASTANEKNAIAYDNSFINCVFYNDASPDLPNDINPYLRLFEVNRANENNKMINCIVSEIKFYKKADKLPDGSDEFSLDFNFVTTDFWNTGFFTNENGPDTLYANPLFTNVTNGNFHIANTSPCVNAGLADTTGLGLPSTDYYGNTRIVGGTTDIGIHETTVLPQNYALEFNTDTDSTKNEGVVALTGFSTLTTCTIEAWIKPSAYENGNNEENVILRHDEESGACVSIYDNDSHNLSWDTHDAQGSTTTPLNTWTHIALVAQNDSLLAMYVNGNLETISGTKSIHMPNGDIVIGNYNYDCHAEDFRFVGAIDELRIWNDIRTQAEIQGNKNKILTGYEPNLISYWDFNDGSGTVLTNKVSGGVNGTLKNMEASDWVAGVSSLSKKGNVRSGKANAQLPSKYELSQNYPNPFNPSTTINFTIPKSQNVELAVYNILGEKVAELVNSNMDAGNHSVVFNANNFSSGIYIYRITAGNFVSIKKMMLLK